MAAEQPQSIPVDPKVPSLVAEKDKMAIDEPATEVAKGEKISDETRPQNDEASLTNGTKESPKPTTASADLEAPKADATPAIPNSPEPAPEDSEMVDVNGTADSESAKKSEESTAGETTTDAPVKEGTPVSKSESKLELPVEDSMEVDTSVERPDLSSSAEHGESTQDTSAMTDNAGAASPQELSQSADVSQLEIKSPVTQLDVSMSDRAGSPVKLSRERDEDEDEEPLAKRVRVDSETHSKVDADTEKAEDSIGVATGLSPAPANSMEDLGDDIPDDQPVTSFQNREIRGQLARIKKTKNGMNFRASVEKLWPAVWENYKLLITDPVDLSLFEAKFRDGKYTTFGDFKVDLRLLYDNALKFNGPSNTVTIAAGRVRDDLFGKLKDIAKAQEPAKVEKGKAQPTRHTEPRAATQPRRQSQSKPAPAATSPKPKATSPVAAVAAPVPSSAPAFALPPNGVPQIRRDSTRDDGDRPKRPIHPPKNRDPDYSSKNARKKKLEPEMKFYDDVLSDLKKQKYWGANQWFLEPVDPVALNIPTYFSVIKKPMDLRTMSEKIENGEYRSGKEVEKDMKQIVLNSELFNGEGPVTNSARDLETLFKEKVLEKDNWMAKNYPPSAPSATASVPSPEASENESDGESEAEPEEEPESIRNLQSRLSEEQEKLTSMLSAKKPDLTMIEIQQNVVSLLQRKLVEEKSKAPDAKKAKPKKKPTKPKPKASAAATGTSGGSKKATGGAASSSKKNGVGNKKSQPKKRSIGQLEKTVITEGIGELDGPTLDKAVEIIKRDTNQKEDDDGQLELDIEVLSQEALVKLFELINRSYPQIYENVSQRPEFSNRTEPPVKTKGSSSASKPKKNKPMNKHEQERNIEKLRELKAQFQRQGSGSQEPVPAEGEEERAGNSSEEESDSEEE
ncbi:hypothetical protein BX600DRAFT_506690 [Xylariales sp. PMI_506]|nr:hypothetical protein BX600DRAFT_506690 [Xylariales sp. PMI_506]